MMTKQPKQGEGVASWGCRQAGPSETAVPAPANAEHLDGRLLTFTEPD